MMVSAELFDALRNLTRADKLHILQFLASELAHEEMDLLQPGQEYPVWSPYDAYEAAGAMLEVLNAAEANDRA